MTSITRTRDQLMGNVGRSHLSLLRIGVWCIVWFVVLGTLVPVVQRQPENNTYNNVAGIRQAANVSVVSPGRGDISGFNNTASDDAFRVVWIAGSSIQSISPDYYTFVPAEVSHSLPAEIDGREVVIDVMFLSGIRIVDIYFAALTAMETSPDLLVVTMNPIWVLNNTATHDWPGLDPLAVQAGASNPSAWSLLARYTSPSDYLLAATAAVAEPVKHRKLTGQPVDEKAAALTFLDPDSGTAPQASGSELDRIRAMRIPVAFWRTYRQAPVPGQSLSERQLQFLTDSTLDTNTANFDVLRALGKLTADTDTLTFLYMAPVSPEILEDPAVDAVISDIEATVEQARPEFSAPNQYFDSENLARKLPPFAFNDIIHLKEVGEVAEYLGAEICEFASGAGFDCVPPEPANVAPVEAEQAASTEVTVEPVDAAPAPKPATVPTPVPEPDGEFTALSVGWKSVDFDADGSADVLALLEDGVARSASSAVDLWTELVEVPVTADALLAGDFDGDGRSDLVRLDQTTAYLSSGGTESWAEVGDTGVSPDSIGVGDFDGDGSDELLRWRAGAWEVSALAPLAWNELAAGASAEPVRVGDFNGDRSDDLLRARGSSLEVYSTVNQTWEYFAELPGSFDDIRIADFDGDGSADVVAVAGSRIQLWDGSSWVDRQTVTATSTSVLLGDFDGDERSDVVELRPSPAEPGKFEWFFSAAGVEPWILRTASFARPHQVAAG